RSELVAITCNAFGMIEPLTVKKSVIVPFISTLCGFIVVIMGGASAELGQLPAVVPGGGAGTIDADEHPPMMLPPAPAMVTAPVGPVPASTRPTTFEPAPTVILASATTVPRKLVPFSVADVPTRQKMLQGFAVPTTAE